MGREKNSDRRAITGGSLALAEEKTHGGRSECREKIRIERNESNFQ